MFGSVEKAREAAAKALGKVGDIGALDCLVYATSDDEKWAVRRAAAEALGELSDPGAVPPLISVLLGKDDNLGRVAGQALVKIGEPAAEPLIDALRHKDLSVRARVDETFIKLDKLAVKPLISALGDENRYVRWSAATILGELGDTQAVEPLVRAMADRDNQVREAADEALVRIGEPSLDPVMAALQDKDQSPPRMRRLAAKVLGELGCTHPKKQLIDTLIEALKDRQVSKEARASLVRIGQPAIEPLRSALQDKSKRKAAEKTLREINRPELRG
jgi:HEAT repeat protein